MTNQPEQSSIDDDVSRTLRKVAEAEADLARHQASLGQHDQSPAWRAWHERLIQEGASEPTIHGCKAAFQRGYVRTACMNISQSENRLRYAREEAERARLAAAAVIPAAPVAPIMAPAIRIARPRPDDAARRPWDWLGFYLGQRTRVNLFEPSLIELEREHLLSRQGCATTAGRWLRDFRYATDAISLSIECVRVAAWSWACDGLRWTGDRIRSIGWRKPSLWLLALVATKTFDRLWAYAMEWLRRRWE